MGCDINKTIKTSLDYEDICLIAVTFGMYQESFKHTADSEILDRMRKLVNRLGSEMAKCKQTER